LQNIDHFYGLRCIQSATAKPVDDSATVKEKKRNSNFRRVEPAVRHAHAIASFSCVIAHVPDYDTTNYGSFCALTKSCIK